MSLDLTKIEGIKLELIDKLMYLPDFLEIKYSNIKEAGLGIFAKKNIPKGKFLGNYVGELKPSDSFFNWNPYIFETIISNKKYKIDANDITKSNWTRFINCSYNNKVENVMTISTRDKNVYVRQSDKKEIVLDGYVLFYSKRDINIGEELLFNYGTPYLKQLNIPEY